MDALMGRLEEELEHLFGFDLASLSRPELADSVARWWRFMDRCATFGARLLGEADRALVHAGSGHRDVADWVSSITNTSKAAATRSLRLADTLERVEGLADAVVAGEVTAAAVQAAAACVAHAPADADTATLLEALRGQSPGAAREHAEQWLRAQCDESPEAVEDRRYQRRSVTFSPALDGMITTTAVLAELEAGELRQTLSAIAGKPAHNDGRTTDQRLADGLIQLVAAYGKGTITGGRENTALLVVGSVHTWAGLSNEPGRTVEGVHVPAHVLRRLAADAWVQRVVTAGAEILQLGRAERFATDAQWRALVVRDRCCRWPGCRIPARWCDIDHIVSWETGGVTDLDDLVLLCRHHHREKHRRGVEVAGNALSLRLKLANGTLIDCRLRSSQAAA